MGILAAIYGLLPGATPRVPHQIYCDAETVRGKQFVTNGTEFSGGTLQSDGAARSGSHSCRVPAGEGLQYGFGYRWTDHQPGERYRARVWTRHRPNVGAYLVVSADATDNGADLYTNTSEVLDRDADGWQLLELEFLVPYHRTFGELHVYVYGTGASPVFFDDLHIERLDRFAEHAFRPVRLELNFPEASRRRLEEKRAAALRLGLLVSADDDWVDAELTVPERPEPLAVEVRLKGDWLDHLSGNKWSYRVKIKDGAWRGMTVFSLQTPEARYFLHEWLLHQFYEQQDVLTTRYDFVELRIDGTSRGIYAYEEHFAKQLVEHRARREGPLVRFDEVGFWAGYRRQLETTGDVDHYIDQPERRVANAEVSAFGAKRVAGDPKLQRQYDRAADLLRGYQTGTLAASEVFDLDRTARFYATADLFGAYHGTVWHNQRFYFNPVTQRLEPIGYDGFGGPPTTAYTFLGEGRTHPDQLDADELFQTLFLDTAFVVRYHAALYDFTDRRTLRTYFDTLGGAWQPRLTWLRDEFPDYEFSKARFVNAAQKLRARLLPLDEHSVRAERLPGGTLQLTNVHTLPVEVLGFGVAVKSQNYRPVASPLWLPAHTPRRFFRQLETHDDLDWWDVRGTALRALRKQTAALSRVVDAPPAVRTVFYRLPGVDSTFRTAVATNRVYEPDYVRLPRFAPLEPTDNELFTVRGRVITFRRGRHTLTKNLVFPAGYRVRMIDGTELDLRRGAAVLSYSPVELSGSAERPVRIGSSDGTGNGFHVLTAAAPSSVSDAVFENLNTLNQGGWTLTGAVTFYESDVRMRRVAFLRNRCEDGLNIVRSEVDLERIRVQQTPFDGFDCDFCRGTVRWSQFLDTDNDGLDVSGSILRVRDCTFANNRDKAISAGEASDLAVFDAEITGANIGVASKDHSMVVVENLTLRDCTQGFAAYQKKTEYGPAVILARGVSAAGVERLVNAAADSRIEVAEVQ